MTITINNDQLVIDNARRSVVIKCHDEDDARKLAKEITLEELNS